MTYYHGTASASRDLGPLVDSVTVACYAVRMTPDQTQALAALRTADEGIRLRELAFSDGKMCACAVIAHSLRPGSFDPAGNSCDLGSGVGAVYNLITDIGGVEGMQEIIKLNDAVNLVTNIPLYTFREIADQMERFWA